jgi:hypothetical protein
VLVVNVCQGACLGQQDSWTPMLVCLGMTAASLGETGRCRSGCVGAPRA